MKFYSVNAVKDLQIDEPIYVMNAAGQYGFGKMVEEKKSSAGTTRTFEIAQFFNEDKPAIAQVLATDITHVCVIRERPKETKQADVADDIKS